MPASQLHFWPHVLKSPKAMLLLKTIKGLPSPPPPSLYVQGLLINHPQWPRANYRKLSSCHVSVTNLLRSNASKTALRQPLRTNKHWRWDNEDTLFFTFFFFLFLVSIRASPIGGTAKYGLYRRLLLWRYGFQAAYSRIGYINQSVSL